MSSSKPSMSPPSSVHQRGFTLVEVMVALVVVAVAISSLLTRVMATVDSTAQLRDKAIANWVALNQLELLYIANENPASSSYNRLLDREVNGKEEMAGRQWFWRIKPLKGVAERSVPVQINVGLEDNEESSVISVIGVIDAFHEPL